MRSEKTNTSDMCDLTAELWEDILSLSSQKFQFQGPRKEGLGQGGGGEEGF